MEYGKLTRSYRRQLQYYCNNNWNGFHVAWSHLMPFTFFNLAKGSEEAAPVKDTVKVIGLIDKSDVGVYPYVWVY